MAKVYLHAFTVMGSRAFPLDMLRRDRCTPDTSDDVFQLSEAVTPDGSIRTVRLLHFGIMKNWSPDLARWRSFEWEVVGISLAQEVRS